MPRYVVLLRGVNVGRANRIRMPDLRDVLAAVGCGRPVTHLQSGNAAVDWDGDEAGLAAAVQAGLADRLDLHVEVMARDGAALDAVVAGNPFGEPADPTSLHVAFLSAQPDPALVAALEHQDWTPDRLAVGDRVLYLAYTAGSRDSPLSRRPPRLGVSSTARNWRTVLALRDLVHDSS